VASNLDVITDAYRMGNVIPMTQAPGSELGQAALRHLNDMLATWASDGIDLGWFPQTELADDAPVDDGVIAALKANLALILVGIAGLEPPTWVVRQATKTYDSLLRVAVVDRLEPADMSNMPLGDGAASGFDIDSGWN
jgi:hypothetical protein